MNFTDEEFLDFTEALSDIFASNYLDNTQLWSWRNDGDVMRAWRYAPVPEEYQVMTPSHSGEEEIFSVFAYRGDDGGIYYSLGLASFQCISCDSLETLIDVMAGIVKSLKLSARYSGEVASRLVDQVFAERSSGTAIQGTGSGMQDYFP